MTFFRLSAYWFGFVLGSLIFLGGGAQETRAAERARAWAICPLFTGTNDRLAECTVMHMPLNWSGARGATIPFFVKRLLGKAKSRPHKQVWLIAGGPGYPGSVFESLAQSWSLRDPALDFYLPDHRGTGRSERLLCPQAERCNGDSCVFSTRNPLPLFPENRWAECLAEVGQARGNDFLKNFTITNAAKDLVQAIRISRMAGQSVFIFGGSYGTILVQRYLQLAGDQVAGVIIKGFSAAGIMDGTKWDFFHDEVGRKIFAACAEDSACNAKLGGGDSSPWEKLEKLLAQLQSNPNYCLTDAPDGHGGVTHDSPVSYDKLRGFLALYMDVPAVRDALPALVYRVARCSPADKIAIAHFRANYFENANLQPGQKPAPISLPPKDSEILQNIVLASELIALPAKVGEVAALDKTLSVSARVGLSLAVEANTPGTLYPRDQYFGTYPRVKVPMLMLNGDLDPSTPFEYAQEVAAIYQGQSPEHYFFRIPRGGHTGEGDPACAAKIIDQFLKNPALRPDGSCLSRQPELDFFHRNDSIATKLFGGQDLWE